MKMLILAFVLLLPLHSNAAPCGPCQEIDKLAADWAQTPPEKNDEVSERSSRIMKELRTLNQHSLKNKTVDADVVHGIVATLGIIYLHDDDPLDDELVHLRSALKNKAFRSAFDQEVQRLPNDQKEKLMVGIQYIDNPNDEEIQRK